MWRQRSVRGMTLNFFWPEMAMYLSWGLQASCAVAHQFFSRLGGLIGVFDGWRQGIAVPMCLIGR